MNLEKQRVGDYLLGEQLRQDATGTVYRGSHAASANEVAVKVLPARFTQDPALVARFKKEAEALRRIQHPGIAEVIDHGESPHGLYLVTEGLAGESLADRLKREGRLSLAETQRIVAALASALSAAHRMRVVHRDLHADNVFLVAGAGGPVKVLDLGLAKIVGDPGRGTPREVDQRADIHALGSLAYEMLCGSRPVQSSAEQGAGPQQRAKPAPLSTHGVTVPSAVEAAILKALEKKKKRRFSSMAEFAQAFGVVLAAPVPARPAPPEPAPVVVATPMVPPTPPPAPGAERANTLTGLVRVRARELGRTVMDRRQLVARFAGVGAAVLVLSWFVLRLTGPSEPVATDVKPPAPTRVVPPRQVPPPPPQSVPVMAPSRVADILELNRKAVSAYARSDVKTARALLEDADKLAVASGYEAAPVRAQTQVRLGALWIGGQKNPRVGRRYLAKAVAINPAVNLPAPMMNRQVRKTLQSVRETARLAKNGAPKRGLKAKTPRRTRNGKRRAT